ncbi:MAG: extracellular solute-binding protein, partial [Candidatus Saganbacteria bacterium]|nr:extracellular solute-binding protein [Candidatus Saganbacteria bacterium]
MPSYKKLLCFVFLILIPLSLTSCQLRPKEEKVTEIIMWVMPNSLEPINDLKLVLKPFEDSHPNIKIKVSSVDWGAAWTKITTAATSRDVPDIAQLGSTWVGSISSMNALLDLTDKVAEIGGKDAFVPAAWASSGIAGSRKVTAIPWFVDARALYYRTDVFKQLGLSEGDLATWGAFERTLKKIKDAKLVVEGKNIVPLGISGKNDWNVIHNLSPWIWAAGGEYLSGDNKSCVLDGKNVIKGVSFYLSLVRKGYIPLEYLELNTAQVSSNFNNGVCAMYFDGPYEVKTLSTPPQQGGALGSLTSRNL